MRISDQVLTGRVRFFVEKTAHGFVTGDAVYFDGTNWQKAKADIYSTTGIGVVEVFDVDKFFVITTGYISGLSGLTIGKTYFVSDSTAGLLTDVESNLYSNPLLIAISATEGVVLSDRPQRFSDNNQLVTQVGHGFTVGQILKINAGVYSLAQADSGANLGIWMVTEVVNADVFRVAKSGFIAGLTGGTADETWFLSDTVAGGLTNVAPTIAQPIIYWVTATSGWLLGYPAAASGTPTSGSVPNGYNKLDLTFTGNTITYEGDIVVQGQLFGLNNSVIVSGGAGWRYGVIDTSGNASHEAIPPAEIVADTQQYTPTPPFDSVWNGYYSSVNPTKRIAWILYFDGTNIIEAIPYGDGHNKNDDFWKSEGIGVAIGTDGYRFQYTSPFSMSRGTNILIVDNGMGVTDSEGFRIVALKAGRIEVNLEVVIAVAGVGSAAFNINKKGQNFKDQAVLLYNTQAGFPLNFNDIVQPGDYYTFYIDTVSGSVPSYIQNPSVKFMEY